MKYLACCVVIAGCLLATEAAANILTSTENLRDITWYWLSVDQHHDGMQVERGVRRILRDGVLEQLKACGVPVRSSLAEEPPPGMGGTLDVDVDGITKLVPGCAGESAALYMRTFTVKVFRKMPSSAGSRDSLLAVVWSHEVMDVEILAGQQIGYGGLQRAVDEFCSDFKYSHVKGTVIYEGPASGFVVPKSGTSVSPPHQPGSRPSVVCDNCQGAGRYRCRGCGGSGSAHGPGAPAPPVTPPCRLCNGSGIQVCPACGGRGMR